MQLLKIVPVLLVCFAYDAAEELCMWETFSASCSSGEVISIERAIFSRMRSNRCINMTVNEPNCSVDIRHQFQTYVGLQRNIDVKLSSELFTKNTPNCLNGQMPFLDISHQCIKSITNEVCIHETFNATCPTGTTIFIQSALFGRMHGSRCIEFDKNDLSCYANVQPFLETLCNGQSECKIKANDDKFKDIQGSCPKSLKPYLEVSYTCPHVSEFNCPPIASFTLPVGATTRRITDGYSVTCNNETKILICRNEKWNIDPETICNESHLLQLLAFGIPAGFLLLAIISVVFLLQRIQKNARRRKANVVRGQTLTGQPVNCDSEYEYYGELDDVAYGQYSEVRETGQ